MCTVLFDSVDSLVIMVFLGARDPHQCDNEDRECHATGGDSNRSIWPGGDSI
jgi:hypothetical protein